MCIVMVPPLIVLFVCSFLIGELPSNLIMQGRLVEAKVLLKRIRGIEEVDEYFSKIALDSAARKNKESPYMTIFKNYRHPALISTILIPLNLFLEVQPLRFWTNVISTSWFEN